MITSILKSVVKQIRNKFYLRGFKNVGKNITLFFPLTMEGKQNIEIGNNTAIGTYAHLWGHGGVKIGNDVLIAAHCCISSLSHDYSQKLIREGMVISAPVVIEDDVWLGHNVCVLPGVTIGKGSVIGAGSVVVKSIPPYSIAVGNPAKIIKQRIVK